MLKFDGPTLRRAMQEHFDAGTLAKGRVYYQQRRVLEVSCGHAPNDGWLIAAAVRGSHYEPYEVTVVLTQEEGVLDIESDCSCPMDYDCKHVVAALLRVAEQPAVWDPGVPTETDLALLPDAPALIPRRIRPEVQAWLQQVAHVAVTKPDAPIAPEAEVESPEQIVFTLRSQLGRVKVELMVARRLKKGGYGSSRNYQFTSLLFNPSPARFVRPADLELGRKLVLAQNAFNTHEVYLEGTAGLACLQELLATDRCYWRGSGQVKLHQPLKPGAPRVATPGWNADARGFQTPTLRVEPPVTAVLLLTPPWYVDALTGDCGPLETSLSPAVAAAWLNAPAVAPAEAVVVAAEIAGHEPAVALPPPRSIEIREVTRVKPVPCLRLYSTRLKKLFYGWGTRVDVSNERELGFAKLEFDYAGARIEPHVWQPLLEHYTDGKLQRIQRDLNTERRFTQFLTQVDLQPANACLFDVQLGSHGAAYTFADENDWIDFVHVGVPELRQSGWQIDIDDQFHFRLVQPDDWYTDAAPEGGGNDWFGVELGVMVEGQKVNLLPVLLEMLRTDPHLLHSGELAKLSDNAVIPVPLADGRKVLFPAGRARQMLGALLELLNPNALNADGKLRLPKLRALELADAADWRWLGAAELREMSARLRNFAGIEPVAPPTGLRATLRPYQQDGLNWLQFLRAYGLAGVLADDMGLGKTVQALAHLLLEKHSGRMDRPSLVIAPTSLMTNWRQETERFAPDLRVLVLHGQERKLHFDRVREHDLIVTSYSLLPRDHAMLREQEFHCVILDEAQFIKNPKTQYAQIACALKARHHLCLTGTPMENHLGELWSLFQFLLPGFLGDEIRFNSLFRRPIERGKNEERRKLLAHRVHPFILRRKKDEVVRELPPKTEIVQNVELTGGQRDLYESVRLAMHQRVKAEVDRKGLSRAHIIILDALLKLRQICCHPQLLSLPSAQKVTESAKLELLMDLVPEMIEEGRRILLFSQFTSMLALIEKELEQRKIAYVQLTGETRDRATPVARFQKGEVPLFLISLKAGGTGLNLTAADTVIHYDPWWNPAVENQATDRAHRIGQDKKVFVYKLLTVGTVEEKIAAMQARKRELVEGLLNEERRESLKLTANDLDVLFAPLEAEAK